MENFTERKAVKKKRLFNVHTMDGMRQEEEAKIISCSFFLNKICINLGEFDEP